MIIKTIAKKIPETISDKKFIKKAVGIAIPVALQNLLMTFTNLVDTVMIGGLGASSIAAVGLANKFFFVFSLLIFGICSGASVLAAQFYGNDDHTGVRKITGLCFILSVCASISFFIPALLAPQSIMRIFTNSIEAVVIGSGYLSIACFTYIFFGVNSVMIQMMRATGRVKAPVYTSFVAVSVNVVLNYTLILGHFGAPALGVKGAAIATLIARVVEFTALVCLTFREGSLFRGKISDFTGWSESFIHKTMMTALPVICNEFMWGLGTTLYSVAYGRMGDNAVASMTVAQTVIDMIQVLWIGLSAATSVILGNTLGAGKLDEAEDYAYKFCISSVILSFAAMALLFFTKNGIISIFNAAPDVAGNTAMIINMFILVFVPKMLNFIIVVGILRAGGDTTMCLFIDTSGVWFIGAPLAFLGALVWHTPIHVLFLLVSLEEFYKLVLGLWRVSKKKWLRNIAIEV
mgnify:FL=1